MGNLELDSRMKVFGGFLLVAQNGARAECGPGMATGIDASGAADSSNTDTCYPTSAAAFIMSCNNPDTQAAEMKIAIEKSFFETNLSNLEGFAEESGNYVKSVSFAADGSNKRVTDDGADLELFMSVSTDAEYGTNQGQQIIMAAQKNLEFSCKYSLEDQTISSTTNTIGSDITINRASRGNLVYTLTADEKSVVGQKKNFSIVPANPGVVHSLVESCEILNDDETRQYGLTEVRTTISGTDTCTDWLTAFAIESGPWCSDQQQDFSFTSFKWDSAQASESQKIRCKIQLKTEHQAYSPGTCSVTTSTTTTTTTSTTTTTTTTTVAGLGTATCGTLHENTGLDGWTIGVDDGGFDGDIYSQGFGDSMSAIVMAPGCTMSVWEHEWENGNIFTCDNTGGTEALVCDNMSSNNMDNKADSYRCSCPKVYEYELIGENKECPGQIHPGGDGTRRTLQDCINQAAAADSGCVGNKIEWGAFGWETYLNDPSVLGKCYCYPTACPEEEWFDEGGEHIVSYTP